MARHTDESFEFVSRVVDACARLSVPTHAALRAVRTHVADYGHPRRLLACAAARLVIAVIRAGHKIVQHIPRLRTCKPEEQTPNTARNSEQPHCYSEARSA